MAKKTLTLDDLTPLQRQLFARMMQGRERLYQADLEETIRDIARLSDVQVREELRWYRVSRPETTGGSSTGYAMDHAN